MFCILLSISLKLCPNIDMKKKVNFYETKTSKNYKFKYMLSLFDKKNITKKETL